MDGAELQQYEVEVSAMRDRAGYPQKQARCVKAKHLQPHEYGLSVWVGSE